MILKTNLHLHTNDDPKDNIDYSAYEAVDYARKLNFDVLAITCHQKVVDKKEYSDYAAKKNILLISGIEAKIEKKDLIILNCKKDAENVKTFKELKKYKNKNPQIFIMAPHPYVWAPRSLKSKLEEYIDLCDAIELTVFSNKIFNFNKRAKQVAKKYKKPTIASSDTHFLPDINRGYGIVEIEPTDKKTPTLVFEAIKKGRIQNYNSPMNLVSMTAFLLRGTLRRAKCYSTSSHFIKRYSSSL
jgi:hypothetical protein